VNVFRASNGFIIALTYSSQSEWVKNVLAAGGCELKTRGKKYRLSALHVVGILFAACDAEERLWYEFFMMTGEREQEVMYTYWTDINFKASIVRVSHKPERGWTPKAYKEREIPIPAKLATSLRAWKAKAEKTCDLVFPTSGCKVKMNFLDDLKAVAQRAEQNPEEFWLHKFRATFATRCLWAGVDLRTVQQWLGHSDMESTMRYLKPSRSQQVRDKVNEIFGGVKGTMRSR
jgi:integrase/recombinase XerD